MDRPDWNAPAPAPSPEQVIQEVATQDQPSPETAGALGDASPPVPAVPALARDAKGNVIRPDWGPKTPAPVPVSKDPTRPDWNKPRNESGQFITASENQLRETWDKEGGYQAAVVRIQEAESTMLSLSDNPEGLQAAINELPKDIAMKAADVMRLSTGYGQSGGAMKAEQFLNSLSESEFTTVKEWFSKLSKADQDAIIVGITR
jgi:hypothetical protein